MKNRAAKLALLFGLYIGLHFVAACYTDRCDCPNVDFPYFDFRALTIAHNDPAMESGLKLDVTPAQIRLLAVEDSDQRTKFNFLTTAWACDCNYNGGSGPKFPVTALNIFADRDFDDQHPRDSSLTGLFVPSNFQPISNYEYPFYGIYFEIFDQALRLTTLHRPEHEELPIRFTIQVIKSNNDTLRVQTDTIRFQ